MSGVAFPVEIDEAIWPKIKRLIEKDGRENAVLRVGVKGGGCSGFEYLMRIDSGQKANDLVLNCGDFVVVCDPKSAQFLEGSVLTSSGNLIGGGFKFENPNAARSCGCGSSFTPKPVR